MQPGGFKLWVKLDSALYSPLPGRSGCVMQSDTPLATRATPCMYPSVCGICFGGTCVSCACARERERETCVRECE